MPVVFSTCKAFIRTVPALQHDPSRAEDLDTEAEDHVADEARYGCMSRPWVPQAWEQTTEPKATQRPSFTTDDDGNLAGSHTAREIVEYRMRLTEMAKRR